MKKSKLKDLTFDTPVSDEAMTRPAPAGPSGDDQGLSSAEDADFESVEDLVDEGQSFEAGIISGIENAPPADVAEVTTREVPEDDVPLEYLDEDEGPSSR